MTKQEIAKIIYEFLKENPKTSIGSIKGSVEAVLKKQGKIGRLSKNQGGMTVTETVGFNDDDALLINEVISDLMYKERVLTPGVNADNLDLPFLHVSNGNKLNSLIEQIESEDLTTDEKIELM